MSLVGHQMMSSTEPSTCWSPVEFNPAPKIEARHFNCMFASHRVERFSGIVSHMGV